MFPSDFVFPIIVKTKSGPLDWPVLICCNEDMCNYMDSMDINIQVSSSTKSNGSIHKGKQNAFSCTSQLPVCCKSKSFNEFYE